MANYDSDDKDFLSKALEAFEKLEQDRGQIKQYIQEFMQEVDSSSGSRSYRESASDFADLIKALDKTQSNYVKVLKELRSYQGDSTSEEVTFDNFDEVEEEMDKIKAEFEMEEDG